MRSCAQAEILRSSEDQVGARSLHRAHDDGDEDERDPEVEIVHRHVPLGNVA